MRLVAGLRPDGELTALPRSPRWILGGAEGKGGGEEEGRKGREGKRETKDEERDHPQ